MIRILDPVTANGIAAGEVIERPASVVKELVENALDAGASRLSIEIVQGGIKLIRVADNGSGMEASDARLAFARHATSKINRLEDLDTLSSMGFRGEALASIAAVSRVSLLTRSLGQDQGYFLHLEAGEVLEEGPKAANIGSIFEIRDLFFNTPARYKFLKRDATEAAYVQDLVEKFSFSRPDIAFSLMKDGTQTFVSPGDGKLLSAIYTVWGSDSAEAALTLDNTFEGLKLQGYISRSSHSRKNRSRQIFLVNGRMIQSPLLRAAVDKAIQGHFVKGNFPELVLKIEIPASMVDVNVHPQKTEVRFSDEQKVFRAVYHTVQACLSANTGIKDIKSPSPFPGLTETNKKADQDTKVQASSTHASLEGEKEQSIPLQTQLQMRDLMTSRPQETSVNSEMRSEHAIHVAGPGHHNSTNKNKGYDNHIGSLSTSTKRPSDDLATRNSEKLHDLDPVLQERLAPEEQAAVFAESSIKSEYQTDLGQLRPDLQELASARIIGQVFNTYLLLEAGDNFLMIDQHAAHERILYEKLRSERQHLPLEAPSQSLLQPLSLNFSPLEIANALDQADEIRKMGFDFEEFGQGCLVLRAIPVEFSHAGVNAESAFRAIVEEAGQHRLDEAERLDEILHTTACKAAVKAHDILSFREMQHLVQDLLQLEDPFHCPHGRPVILRLSATDIEKFFNRIV